MMRRWTWAVALVVATLGCIEDPVEESSDAGAGGAALDGSMGGAGGAGGGGAGGADATAPDQGTPDAGPDMQRPDMAVPSVESCQDACNRYATCERFDVWGDEGACLDACERSDEGNDLSGWFDCLQMEACGLIQLCRLPAPPALECDDVCRLAESCDVTLPFADCATECPEFDARDALAACAESLTVCDTARFGACLADDVFPECGRRCLRTEACNIEGPDCIADCVAAGIDEDPLRRVRQTEQNRCISLAGEDCERINSCLVDPEVVGPVDDATFCRAWDRCFADQFPCDLILNEFIEREDPNRQGILACGLAGLQVCPEDPFFLFEECFRGGGGPVGPTCLDLCNTQNICGVLPEGFNDPIACNQACVQTQRENPDQAARIAQQLPCALADSCPDLDACLEDASPVAACAAQCGALDACGLAEDDCAETCDGDFFRQRSAASRECVAEAAGDCAVITTCQPTDPVGCEALCTRQAECQPRLDMPACLAQCDEQDFEDPQGHLRALACTLTAPVCDNWRSAQPHAVNNCHPSQGQGCLGWCRLTTECAGEGDLVACLQACGAGIEGAPGADRLLADACLAEGGNCAALAACVPDAAPPCDAWCGPQLACEIEPEGCGAVCGADALTGLRAHRDADCLAQADGVCEAVDVCLGAEPVEVAVDISQQNLCRLYNQCNFQDGFPCEEMHNIGSQEGGPGVLTCMVRTLEGGCPRGAFDLIEMCLEGGNQADPRADACEDLCDLRAVCGDLGGGDLRTCRATCINTFLLQGENGGAADPRRLEAELPCSNAWSCDDLQACRQALDPAVQCQTHCAALDGCGLGDAVCAQQCDQRFDYQRDVAWRTCVREAGEDCVAVAACAPAPAPDCAGYCQSVQACGFERQGCAMACDDAHFADPSTQALRIACAQNTEQCFNEGQGGASLQDCVFGDPTAGLDPGCVPYCRAVTECDPDAERAFEGCILHCAEGFPGEEGLTFAAARACSIRLGPQARCADLTICLPPEPPALDCAAQCESVAGCGIAGVDCVATCEEADDRPVAACVMEAVRTESGCAAIAACVGFEAPPVPAACERLCARQTACDPDVDDFVCRLGCSPAPEGLEFRAACASYAGCNAQAACDAVDAADPACAAPCAAAAACGGFDDVAACAVECTGYRANPGTNAAADQAFVSCLEDASDVAQCAAPVQACFDSIGSLCDEACELIVGCGLGAEPTCPQDCRQASQEDPQFEDGLNCMLAALGDGRCDINAVEFCFEGQGGGEPPPDRDPPPDREPPPVP